jgi:uncharacterized protein (TIGR02231 family)
MGRCLLWVSWLCLGIAPQLSRAATDAPVRKVTLYPGGALVERVAGVGAGESVLRLSGLPANFDLDSVQIEAEEGIEIGEAVWRDEARTEPLNAEEAALENDVRALSLRLESLLIERRTAERELAYLASLSAVDPEAGVRNIAARPKETLALIHSGSLDAERRILNIDTQSENVKRALEGRKKDLERIRPAVEGVRQLSLRLAARKAGEVRVRYLFPDAGWRPAYRAFLNSEDGVVRLERVALIAQRSGEDWNRVRLVLSTGQPKKNSSGPEPESWRLRFAPDVLAQSAAARRRIPGGDADSFMNDAESMAVLPMMAMSKETPASGGAPLFETAAVHGEFSTEFTLPGVFALPADGRQVSATLGEEKISVALEARMTPRAEKAAWLVARAEFPEGVWPPGIVRLYRDGNYVGESFFQARDDARLSLPFGRDDKLRVNLRPLADTRGHGSFLARKNERRIADIFTVTSLHKKRALKILVLEASPVALDTEIVVERRQFSPAVSVEDWEGRPGVVAWETTLPAGETREFSVDYLISWPEGRRVGGLERF